MARAAEPQGTEDAPQHGSGGSPAAQGPAAVARVLMHRNFGPYFAGNLLSNTGTWFQNIAQALLIYRLTGSVFLVGVVNFAQFLGVLVFASWAGVAADRFDRRRLVIATQVGAMAVTGTLAALAAVGDATTPVVIALALLLGCTTAFSAPTLKALVPTLVERVDLQPAVTLDSVTFNLARVLGPVVAVAVVGALGIAWAFGINCLSYAALIVALLVIEPHPGERARGRPQLRESVKLIWADRRLLYLMLAIAAVAFASDPVNTLGPAFAVKVYHSADTLTGFLVGAFGAGAVVAAVFSVRRTETPFRLLGLLIVAMAAGTAVFALVGPLAAGLAGLFVAGFGYLAAQTQATTLVLLAVEDAQRGRAMALWSVAFLGTRPIASLIDGSLAGLLGIQAAAVLMALPLLASAGTMVALQRARARI